MLRLSELMISVYDLVDLVNLSSAWHNESFWHQCLSSADPASAHESRAEGRLHAERGRALGLG